MSSEMETGGDIIFKGAKVYHLAGGSLVFQVAMDVILLQNSILETIYCEQPNDYIN